MNLVIFSILMVAMIAGIVWFHLDNLDFCRKLDRIAAANLSIKKTEK